MPNEGATAKGKEKDKKLFEKRRRPFIAGEELNAKKRKHPLNSLLRLKGKRTVSKKKGRIKFSCAGGKREKEGKISIRVGTKRLGQR